MSPAAADADVCVLLTPRALGGHEIALLGWLADAVRQQGLRPLIVAPSAALAQACVAAGLADWMWPANAAPDCSPAQLLQQLRRWPAGRPLLLAPGTLHTSAWLLAAALAWRHQVWVYVPMAFSARHMGYRHAGLRDRLLALWLQRVSAWITLDARQADWLRRHWRVQAPVHLLPNIARLPPSPDAPLALPQPAPDQRLRIAFVGRFDMAQKGLDWLVELLRHNPDWQARYRWHFQGRGAGEQALLELASALGPQHAVVRAHAPLLDALAVNDVLLLPSRYEGLPLVALEACALGWPVVASRAAGLDALLPSDSLFDHGDGAGLQRALNSLRRPQARAAAVVHARKQMAALHSADSYHGALACLVQAITGRNPGRQPC